MRHCDQEFSLEALGQVVPLFDRPVARHENVEPDERAPPRPPAADGMKRDPLGASTVQNVVNRSLLVLGQHPVDEPSARAAD